MTTDLQTELEALYGGAFETFVEARNRLAQTLKKAGQAEASAQVKALAKPSLAAWAVNQLHRQEPKAFAALLTVGDALRGAEGALMRGGDALRAVTRKQREHVDALTAHAREILADAGHNASDAVLDKIAHTLRSLAVSGWGDVAPGRLAADLTPPGLDALVDALGGMALPPAQRSTSAVATRPTATSPKADAQADAATKREAERARREAEEAIARAELAAGRAEREVTKAKENVGAAVSAAKKAREKAEAARREADEAAARADEADAEVETAREALASAEAEAIRSRDAAREARTNR